MKNIRDIRHALEGIEDVWFDNPPEEGPQGHEGAVSTIWQGNHLDVSALDMDLPKEDYWSSRDSGSDIEDAPIEFDEIFEYGADVDFEELVNAIGDDKEKAIRQSVMVRGVDALAYYIPFHLRGAQWGIYIPLTSIVYMIKNVFNRVPADPVSLMRMAIRAMHQHELFHFAVEYAMAQLELITQTPLHLRSRQLKGEHGYNRFEEQLANANMIRSFRGRRIKGKTEALRNFTLSQPVGYCDAAKSLRNEVFKNDCGLLITEYFSKLKQPLASDAFDAVNLLAPAPIDWRYCPVHLINDTNSFGIDASLIDFFTRVEQIEESKEFRKQLHKLSSEVQKMWKLTKRKLSVSCISNGLDFKVWDKTGSNPVYSVRLNRSYRAHLELKREQNMWSGLKIGDHKSMGHG